MTHPPPAIPVSVDPNRSSYFPDDHENFLILLLPVLPSFGHNSQTKIVNNVSDLAIVLLENPPLSSILLHVKARVSCYLRRSHLIWLSSYPLGSPWPLLYTVFHRAHCTPATPIPELCLRNNWCRKWNVALFFETALIVESGSVVNRIMIPQRCPKMSKDPPKMF